MPLAHLSCVQLVLSRILIFLINLHFFDRPGTLLIISQHRTLITPRENPIQGPLVILTWETTNISVIKHFFLVILLQILPWHCANPINTVLSQILQHHPLLVWDFSNWRTPDSWYCCALRKLFETFLIPLGGKKRGEEKENYRKSSAVLNRIKNLMSSRNWRKSLFCKNKYKYFLISSVSVLNLMRCVVSVSDSQINLRLSSLNLNSPSLQICLTSRLENRSI